MHGVMDAADREFLGEKKRLMTSICQMVKSLAAWPTPKLWSWAPRRLSAKTSPQEAKHGGRVATSHAFLHVGSPGKPFWRCTLCLRGTPSLQAKLFASPCGAVAPSITRLGQWATHHSLHAAVVDNGPEVVLVCMKCGAYCSSLPRNLAGPCGEPKATKERTLRRMERGQHPDPVSRSRVGPTWPVPKALEQPEERPAGP